MIHIFFGESAAYSFKHILESLDLAIEDQVIAFWDIFSVGPVWSLHREEGLEARFNWMKKLKKDEYPDYRKRFTEAVKQVEAIAKGEAVTVWTSDNSSEQTGLRYVLYLMKDNADQIQIINTTELFAELFDRPDIDYTVRYTGEIVPEKLWIIYEAAKNSKPLTPKDRSKYEAQWLTLAENRENLRIWQNGSIKCVPENYCDAYIIDCALEFKEEQDSEEFIKSTRVIGEVIGKLEQHLGDEFFEYRLKKLIEQEVFEAKGSLEALRFYSIRRKSNSLS